MGMNEIVGYWGSAPTPKNLLCQPCVCVGSHKPSWIERLTGKVLHCVNPVLLYQITRLEGIIEYKMLCQRAVKDSAHRKILLCNPMLSDEEYSE